MENLEAETNALTYNYYQCFAGNVICVSGFFELTVGWRVYQSPDNSGYNITYVPFAEGRSTGSFNLTATAALIHYQGYFDFVNAYMPTLVNLGRNGQICIASQFQLNPVNLITRISSNLYQCYEQVLDAVIGGGTSYLQCSYSNTLSFTHLSIPIYPAYTRNIAPLTCFFN